MMVETNVAVIEVALCAAEESELPVTVQLLQSENEAVPVHRVTVIDFFSYFA